MAISESPTPRPAAAPHTAPAAALLRLGWQQPGAAAILGLLIALGLGVAGAVVIQAGLLSQVVSGSFQRGWGIAETRPALLAYLLLAALRALLAFASDSAAARLSRQVRHGLRQRLFGGLCAAGPSGAAQREGSTGALVHTLSETVDGLDAFYSQYLPQIILAACVPAAVLIVVLRLDLLSGLILLLTGPLIPLFMALIGSLTQALTQRQWGQLRSLSAYFLDVIQGLPTLKALGRSLEQAQTIASAGERFRQVTMQVLRLAFVSALILELLSTLSTALVAVGIGLRLLYGRLDFPIAFLILVLAPDFYLPFRLLGLRYHAAQGSSAAAGQVFGLLESLPPLPATSSPGAAGAERMTPSPSDVDRGEANGQHFSTPALTLEGLSYHYPDSPETPVLEEINASLPAGKITALLGPSGAGKSTLAELLLGFLTPTRGRLTWQGRDQAAFSPAAWRQQVSWVSQSPYLFPGSALENLRLARPQATLEEVRAAARQAQADEFLANLPQGYDTPLGERGSRLSGGQLQRLALARAFLKAAPLLILDEPTAHLDSASAAAILRILRSLSPARTVLVITHHLALAALADQVLWLENGRLTPAAPGVGPALRLHAAATESPAQPAQSSHLGAHFTARPAARETLSSPAVVRSLLGFLRPYAGRVLLSALLGAATTGSSMGLMFTAAYLLSAAARQPSIADLQVAIVGVRFFGLARGVLRYLERLASHDTTFRVLARLRLWFFQALEPLVPGRATHLHSGDLLARVQQDIASLENFFVRGAAPPLGALLAGLAAAFFLGTFNPPSGLALLAALTLTGLALPLWAFTAGQRSGPLLADARRNLTIHLVEALQGMPDLWMLDAVQPAVQRLAALSDHLGRLQERQARLNGLQGALSAAGSQLGLAAVLALPPLAGLLAQVQAGELDGVWLGALALAALASFEGVQVLPQAAHHLAADVQAGRRLFGITTPQDAASAAQPPGEPAHPQPVPATFTLEIRDLTFTYPHAPAPALDGVNLTLPVGAHAVLSGPSGAGKSTLAALLLRFWEYTQGIITLDGVELRHCSPAEVRQKIALAPQRPYLFNASLRDNLLLARPQASPAELEAACAAACLLPVIHSLPHRWETPLGENGARLSAGEAQRLAVARALLQQPALLILDEATAHLDPPLAAQVIAGVRAYRQGRSTLWISHDLPGLEDLPHFTLPTSPASPAQTAPPKPSAPALDPR